MSKSQSNAAVAERVCEKVAAGLTLAKAFKKIPDAPSMATWFRWVANDPAIRDMYARARESHVEVNFDSLHDLADSATVRNIDKVKLQIDTRKWTIVKGLPKKYGERVDLNHRGALTIVLDKADSDA